ncbi:hypothetical protein COO16_04120 [Bacillus pseudomycoides]|uniref:hypothetical protein n=1 Tax=Bacillus pseudomycoides TaxID=64104 RepID=UPI000BEB9A5D|nr:hypothetical protein [Bacillus pseudomycoides]PDY14154.1 hypothetical protein COO16_04120 [Bacillus pseudomycoides]
MFDTQIETFDRRPFTNWVVETININPEQFEGFYRTTFKDGKECEQFSLMPIDLNFVLVQIRIYKNGDILVSNFVGANVVVYKREKRVTVELLCNLEITDKGIEIEIKKELLL